MVGTIYFLSAFLLVFQTAFCSKKHLKIMLNVLILNLIYKMRCFQSVWVIGSLLKVPSYIFFPLVCHDRLAKLVEYWVGGQFMKLGKVSLIFTSSFELDALIYYHPVKYFYPFCFVKSPYPIIDFFLSLLFMSLLVGWPIQTTLS